MAINPDNLLIFEVREEIEEKKQAKPKAAAGGKAAKGAAQAQEQATSREEVAPSQGQNVSANEYAENAAPYYKEYPSAGRNENEAEGAVKTQRFVVPEPGEEEIDESIGMMENRAATSAMVSKKGKAAKASKNEEESRDAAQGLYCVWHPWRPAYAICAYCHRPFCFEDIVESNGNYYCLEDIDKVANAPQTSTYTRYNNLGIVSAGMLLVAFIAFLYFGGSQIISMVKFSNTVGIMEFVARLSGPYGFVLLGTIMSMFVLVSAIMIFAQTKRSFMFGMLVSFINLSIFSYEYLNTGTVYEAFISIASFAGLVLLLYSRSTYESEEPEEELFEEPGSVYPTEMPNIGKF
ncbi:MAG: hypothetical protein QXW10_03630 [Candidatus Micrarchaeaceae archaeon]